MIVTTDKGRIEGTTDHGVNVFRGIPYAAPPVGNLRWQAPQAVTAWTDVRPAKEFGPACVQPEFESMDGSEPVARMSEDCLYLNVWTAQGASDPLLRRPVMVWIHGGAYQIGEGASSMYNGAPLAKKGAVVVTLNYRLGHLGFFAHPALEQSVANFGLLDQIAALKWVRENIHRFGGDPGNVTIFGESAGAASVLALYCIDEAKDLFHKGIAQSSYAIPDYHRVQAKNLGVDVANRAWKLGPTPTLAQLRALDEEVFKMKVIPSGSSRADGTPVPVPVPSTAPVAIYGDGVLTQKIRARFAAGTQHDKPLMIGSNSNEQSVLALFKMDPAAILDLIEQEAPAGTIPRWKLFYRNDPEIHPDELEDRSRFGGLVLRDMLFTAQARWVATAQAKKSEAYRYYFAYVPEFQRADEPHGVPHGGEMVFPFNTGDIAVGTEGKFTNRDRAVADKVSNYWFQFAKTGVPSDIAPGSSQAVVWPKHTGIDEVGDQILKLGVQLRDTVHDEIVPESRFRYARLNEFSGLLYTALERIIESQRGPTDE